MNKILLGLFIVVPVFAHSANDLDKWNSEQGRVARSAMKDKLTTTYRELPNHVDSSYRSTENGGKVLRQLETSAEIKGSRVGTTINALKEVDKYAAAKRFGSEFGKGAIRFGVAGILIDQAMQEMLDGIGWIIDEGGKVKKHNPANDSSSSVQSYHQYRYYDARNNSWNASAVYLCRRDVSESSFNLTYLKVELVSELKVNCWSTKNSDGSNYLYNSITREKNPTYNQASTNPIPEKIDVAETEMIQKIRDYFENPKSSPSKDLLIEQAVKPKGKASIKWSDDPASEQTIYSDNKKTAEKVLNSDDPKGEGLTKTTPVITDGTTVESATTTNTETSTNVNETTVTNPDGSTTTTGTNVSNTTNVTNNNFSLPAFCDYASKLCEWIGWTKEEPELNDEKLDIQEQKITDYKYEDHVEWGSQCPFSEKIENLDFNIGIVKVKYNLDFFCDFGRKAKSTIVALGHLGALIFLMIGIRSGASG